ncbi:MAG: N-acetyltransferase [Actinomycetes bacterium]
MAELGGIGPKGSRIVAADQTAASGTFEPDHLLIRDMRWTDIEQAQRIEELSFPVDVWSCETFWSELAGVPERRRYLVGVSAPVSGGADEVVAYAGLAFVGSECDVQTVVVSPDALGCGIGERLLVELLETGTRMGCVLCHLEVRSDNEAAIALYRKYGFEVVSRRVGYYDGTADALMMQVALPAAPRLVSRESNLASRGIQ